MVTVTADMVEAFQRDGVVLVKGLWKDWAPQSTARIERNMAAPGPYGVENLKPGEAGWFFLTTTAIGNESPSFAK